MSKKLLALFISVAACCAFGCSDDDSGNACKTGEKACEGSFLRVCKDGKWTPGTECKNGCDATKNQCKEGETEKKACTPQSVTECSAACSEDKSKAMYWDKKGGAVKVLDCNEGKECAVFGGRAECTTPGTGKTCDPTKDMPKCGENNTVTYCRDKDKQFVEKKDCTQCHVEGDTFFCNGDHLLKDCTKASKEKCRGACDADDPTRGWRWDISGNAIKEWTCDAGKKCEASKTGWLECVPAQ